MGVVRKEPSQLIEDVAGYVDYLDQLFPAVRTQVDKLYKEHAKAFSENLQSIKALEDAVSDGNTPIDEKLASYLRLTLESADGEAKVRYGDEVASGATRRSR